MHRYAENADLRNEERVQDVLNLLQLENSKRQLGMFAAMGNLLEDQKSTKIMVDEMAQKAMTQEEYDQAVRKTMKKVTQRDGSFVHVHRSEMAGTTGMEAGTLHVTVIAAKDLPSMDVMSGTDAYCVLFVDNDLENVFQTKTHSRNSNPTFEERFEWIVTYDAKFVTVTVLDFDKLTRDDVIGHGVLRPPAFLPCS